MRQELLLDNAIVHTLDPVEPRRRALAVSGSELAFAPAPDAHGIDLGGACVLPGLNDSHVHFPTWSLAQRQVRLEDVRSRAEALERVAGALAGVPAGGCLRGYGWREGDWTEPPNRAALDRVAGEIPVALMSKDYHSLWLNGAALARADEPLEVPGGVVERDENGEPLGVLRENAAWSFRDRYLIPAQDEMVAASRNGLALAAERGVTAVHDKDGWMGAFETFQRLQENGELTLRVWQSLPAERLPELRALGLRSGFGNDWLRLGYLKVFMDGTLGSATARLLDGSGVEITSAERLAEIVREGAAAGWPVGVHAIGDAANRAALARADGPLNVPGGVVERDELGEPLGVLRENAAWSFRDRYLIPAQDEMVEASRNGLALAAERGVTAVHDKDGWMGAFETFQRLQESGELTLRVWQSLPAERLPELRRLGLRSGFGNDWLRLGYLKVFMDGTLGSATARLLDGSGVEITSAERLAEIVREGAAAGWPVGVHAIGDAANRAALDAFEATADA
ncbi:MAG: amidohydrolase family protein, partial [Actinomycetota bacterium]|nr:amidohydrolase family protein [Actinomycetota bacterium]